jgi:hypothetical protein
MARVSELHMQYIRSQWLSISVYYDSVCWAKNDRFCWVVRQECLTNTKWSWWLQMLPFIVGVTSAFTLHPRCNSINRRLRSPYNRPSRAQRGSRGTALLNLHLGARRGWVVSITPRALYPRFGPGTHCTGGWVGPRACEKSRPQRDLIPGPSSP